MTRTVTALMTAGSDPSGDTGTQTGLKMMSANGAYVMSAITTLTTRSTRGVMGVHTVPLNLARLQLDTVLVDIRPGATKIGMLATTELTTLTAEYLLTLENTILDLVMAATSGDPFLRPNARAEARKLYTSVELITPGLSEATVPLECECARNVKEIIEQAKALHKLEIKRALAEGGYPDGDASDVFIDEDGPPTPTGRRIVTQNAHETDCTFSSMIAALRPRRHMWADAVRDVKAYFTEATAHADSFGAGHGHGSIHRFYAIWPKEE